ncbi:MAG TPA: DUF6766 family protein [Actinomycetota bacterium]|jgi:hypothetical protein
MTTFAAWTTVLVLISIAGALVGLLIRSIRLHEARPIWANFGLSLAFCGFFLVSWVAHGIAEWGAYVEEQRAHGEAADVTGYVVAFGRSTLENWQSEFLQLFSFVVLAAVLIHRGSAESKDGTDEIQATLKRIEARLDELDPVSTR